MKVTLRKSGILCLLLVLALSLSACSKKPDDALSVKPLTEMQQKALDTLAAMDALISEANLADVSLKDAPWITNSVRSKAVDKQVSLDNAQNYINAYRYYTGDEAALDAKQLLNLLDDPNDSADPAFDRLDKWLRDNGKAKVSIYQDGLRAAYQAYEQNEQKKYADKELPALAAEERFDLAQWATSNPEAGASLDESDRKDYERLLSIAQAKGK